MSLYRSTIYQGKFSFMHTIRFTIAIEYPDSTAMDEVIGAFESKMDELADAHMDWHLPSEVTVH